jgi:hypothetical protein
MTSLERRPETLVVYVRFLPSWNHIEPLRLYIDVAVRSKTRNGMADRATMVAHELLENAVKYGDPTADVELQVYIAELGSAVDVRVSNKAHPSRVAILEREFQRTRGDSAREAFARALQRLQKLPNGTTMLGLARIATEATLQVEVSGDRVIVSARVEISTNRSSDALQVPSSSKR